VSCAVDLLRAFGLTHDDIVVRFSDRRLLNRILASYQVTSEQIPVVYGVFDKVRRTPTDISIAKLQEAGLSADLSRTLESLARNGEESGLLAERMGELRGEAEVERIVKYQQDVGWLLGDSADKWLTLDLSIVRGLAYYTGIVFEIFDRKGELRAICGGGRYDGLLAAVGGVDLPALGFGMGDVVLAELLRGRGLMTPPAVGLDYWVAGEGDAESVVLRVAGGLRRRGQRVEYALREQSLSAQLKAAGRARAREVVIVKPENPPAARLVIKTLSDGAERATSVEELLQE
jgi:histidyl-tRNA synthetase